ncbi:hypothetical protein DVA67_018735 [Solirubrobacter sp. CPCC 204708]|uniref:Uncharacterized protein n=1 Tax=Solirubrobacter deserti TaxID=2282478 RepID=A0ABT4RME0_9ACTN|nr:hypothetical protein [Solirubrobacter deserti]MBE2318025.1 hypothetical protein [Solirubrobacter deserti]MDA0139704.1 hypothetical protein [Solirubrobacter deserti]
MRIVIAALLVFAALSPSASAAPVRALAGAGAGPVISGNHVLFAAGDSVFSEPVWGGPRVAVPPAGVFAELTPPLGDVSPFAVVDPVQASDLGLVTLENGGVWLRRDGRRVEVALPPGANPEVVAVAGTLGVAPVPEGALVVFDLRSGVELRQVSLGAYDPVNLDGLSLSPAGDIAATVPAGDGTGVLLWAAAGASRVRVIASGGSRLGRVAVAGGRVAYVTGAGLREGVRAVVVDPAQVRDPRAGAAPPRAAAAGAGAASPAERGEVLRGPPVYDVTSLSFDGAWLAFSTPTCRYVASGGALRLPGGPCARTEVAAEAVRGGARVACINTPTRACRVRVGARTVSVRRGQARVISARGPLRVRTVDPDGRTVRVL